MRFGIRIFIAVASLLLLFDGLVFAQKTNNDSVEKQIQQCLTLLKEKNYSEALTKLQTAKAQLQKRLGESGDSNDLAKLQLVTRLIRIAETIVQAKKSNETRNLVDGEAGSLATSEASDGFELIFNGENFDGWLGPTENYEIVNGALRCKPQTGGTIYTEQEFDDFVVEFEFLLPSGGNSGLAIRYPGSGDAAYVGMCDLQILDNAHRKYDGLDPRQTHGSAYGMAAAERGYLLPPRKWNRQRVTVTGTTIKVELNGTIILNTDLSKIDEYLNDRAHPGKLRSRGHFGFSGHSDQVEFRTVRIKELPFNR